ncbi:MAG: cell wall-binding repeat-containing protein [Peptoniphilaceae bacterium]|nr:cell wall-binding repeat-containing protein [Peptoniphilaceae bacterium]MDY6086349.1 cell wall-binding repeat-containing protein [Peptoniphilaceae bacterium]
MRHWAKSLSILALALLLGATPAFAQSAMPETTSNPDDVIDDNTPASVEAPSAGALLRRAPEADWDWAAIEKIAADTDADQYKALSVAGDDALVYVPTNAEGRVLFPKDGLAEQITAQLLRVVSQTDEVIPMTVTSAVAPDDLAGRVAQIAFTPTADLQKAKVGLYYLTAQLPEKDAPAIYGYAVVNPKAATSVSKVNLRVYASDVSDKAAPVYASSKAFTVSATDHDSFTPSSGDAVLYPTPIDALLAAMKQDKNLANVQLRPFQNHVLRPLVTGIQIGERDYQVSDAADDVTWRFAVYDANGAKKTQLRTEFADLFDLEEGDTVVWALSAAAFPNVLPAMASDQPNITEEKSGDQGAPETLKPSVWDVSRLSAANRQALAAKVSQTYFPKARRVIVVNDFAFADALSASNLSNGAAPILYTKADRLLSETEAEVKRLAPSEIFVMGGAKSVGEKVVEALQKAAPKATVTRVDGRDRYEVNIHSLDYVEAFPAVVITNGTDFADALTATPLASAKGGVVLLTKPAAPKVLTAFLSRLTGSALYVVGGEKSVAPQQLVEFEKLTGQQATRLSGRDRYAVSGAIASEVFPAAERAIVASGELSSDALIAVPLSQKWGAPILLTRKAAMPLSALDFFRAATSLHDVTVMGGTATVSDGVLTTLRDASAAQATETKPAR